jgi:hypothetical protein
LFSCYATNRGTPLKTTTLVALSLALGTLTACQKSANDQVADNVEANADNSADQMQQNVDAAADNMTAATDNAADQMKSDADNKADAIRNADNNTH